MHTQPSFRARASLPLGVTAKQSSSTLKEVHVPMANQEATSPKIVFPGRYLSSGLISEVSEVPQRRLSSPARSESLKKDKNQGVLETVNILHINNNSRQNTLNPNNSHFSSDFVMSQHGTETLSGNSLKEVTILPTETTERKSLTKSKTTSQLLSPH